MAGHWWCSSGSGTSDRGANRSLSRRSPYGLMISEDCHHLIENPAEKQVLMLAMDLIVQDQKISQVADALNGRGFKTRAGKKWSSADVFNLLPRLIDTGPKIFVSNEWITRHAALTS